LVLGSISRLSTVQVGALIDPLNNSVAFGQIAAAAKQLNVLCVVSAGPRQRDVVNEM